MKGFSPTPKTDEAMAECAKLGGIAEMYGYMVQHAKELETELQRVTFLRRQLSAVLEDKQLCREGFWLCAIGEKMSRELEDLKKKTGQDW